MGEAAKEQVSSRRERSRRIREATRSLPARTRPATVQGPSENKTVPIRAYRNFQRDRGRTRFARLGLAVGLVSATTIIGVLLGAGCSDVVPVDEQTLSEAFPFIRDGRTKKQEVLGRLGAPDNQYESGRIITYLAGMDDRSGHWRVGLYFRARYTLVLVFGPDDLLERHSLVRER